MPVVAPTPVYTVQDLQSGNDHLGRKDLIWLTIVGKAGEGGFGCGRRSIRLFHTSLHQEAELRQEMGWAITWRWVASNLLYLARPHFLSVLQSLKTPPQTRDQVFKCKDP